MPRAPLPKKAKKQQKNRQNQRMKLKKRLRATESQRWSPQETQSDERTTEG
jgi:hypothetical protein